MKALIILLAVLAGSRLQWPPVLMLATAVLIGLAMAAWLQRSLGIVLQTA